MNRRESLKALSITTLSAGVLIQACDTKPGPETSPAAVEDSNQPYRLPEEKEKEKQLAAETFFTPHELATITILADMIIPKDEHSGSASDAKVPEFIEFIVKDQPEHKVPMRGGLRWLDTKCLNRYDNSFKDIQPAQRIEIIEEIAYPEDAKPEMQQGVAFFNRMRGLTASGFFTSKIGIEDLGYVGNTPNKWEGVPADIVKQYGLEDIKFI